MKRNPNTLLLTILIVLLPISLLFDKEIRVIPIIMIFIFLIIVKEVFTSHRYPNINYDYENPMTKKVQKEFLKLGYNQEEIKDIYKMFEKINES